MIREVITMDDENGEEVLSTRCLDLENGDLGIEVLQDLIDTANAINQEAGRMFAIGLAANQIGEFVRVAIVKRGDAWLPLINPVMLKVSTQTTLSKEKCLSRPNLPAVTVNRFKRITIRTWCPVDGVYKKYKLHGLDAIAAQHEMNHLNGVLV